MAKRYYKATKATKADTKATEADKCYTRRVEARRDMIARVPSILEATAKVVDSVVAGQRAHVEGCGSRYAEVALAEHASGVTFLNRVLTIAEETGAVEAAVSAFKAACRASEADSREDVRRSDSVKYEDVVCRPWTRTETVAEPEPEAVAEPEPEAVAEPAPSPSPEPRAKRKRQRRRNRKVSPTGQKPSASDPELEATLAKCAALEEQVEALQAEMAAMQAVMVKEVKDLAKLLAEAN